MTPDREAELLAAIAARDALIECQEQRIRLLERKIDSLVRRIFGAKSEKLDPGQLLLILQGDEPGKPDGLEAAETEPRRPKEVSSSARKARGPRLPEHLPVIEETLDPEPVKACPQDWRCIGEEVSEQLDYEPGRFLRRRLIRRKYVRREEVDAVPVIAPLPACLQERCLAAPGLIAQIIVAKYCDHLPLYRQEQIYQMRHGVVLPRQSQVRWMELAADWLQPIYEHIRTGVMGGGYVQVDETPIAYLEPGNGRTRQGYLWTYHRPGGDVFFDWQTSRAAICLNAVIPAGFDGTLQCDGYRAYRSFAAGRVEAIVLAGCWSHVRRKFHEAIKESPRNAGWFLRQIGHLYRSEAQLREHRAGRRLREAVRASESAPVCRRIYRAMVALKKARRHLPQSLMGQAIDYTLGQWDTLEVWLQDGRIEIDNNLVENAIRPTAIGKKNWLFVGEANAGQRGAILYTMIECCRRRGIDPYAYLCDVLTRLPHMTNWQVKDVTPEAWARSKTGASLRAA